MNGGFSASFIWCLIRIHLQHRDEDTPDYLRKQMKRKGKLRWSTSFTDPGEIIVEISGRFEFHTEENMRAAFGDDWKTQKGMLQRGRDFKDFGPIESTGDTAEGESKDLTSGVSGILANPPGPTPPDLQLLISGYQSLSKKSKAKFHTHLGFSKIDTAMNGQEKSVVRASS